MFISNGANEAVGGGVFRVGGNVWLLGSLVGVCGPCDRSSCVAVILASFYVSGDNGRL